MQHRSFIFSRNNVAGGKGLLSQTTPVKKESAITLTRIAYAVKLVRLPFLLVAISTIGYQQGVTDTLRNPRKLQQRTFESILIDFGVEPSSDQVEIVTERGVRSRFDTPLGSLGRGKAATIDPRSEKIAIVGREILKSARTYVRENFEDAVEKAKDEIMKDDVYIKEQKLAKLLNENSDVKVCVAALERIEGAALEGIQNWSYVLISSPIPNAFVSEMLPQKIFVTTGLFDEIVNNDDELAMILGHEVSHLIKGHGSEASAFESLIRGAEILVLLLDPTEGLLSLGVASFLSTSREALVAALSRENELEADELGCRLAAMSCYDTGRGVEVFRKMQETHSGDSAASKLNLISSHPTSQDRYENVQNLVETQNYSEYSYCNTLQKRIAHAFKQKEY
eukprot:CAMPEP_0201117586 /NCGR_PEP_ID=MMETSP0850-20130426/1551_1 /ASSEMBLY_ACC=CAM_ASM_000622 /TAXON_ID=183588 /ORGANISM="Pseudo-nitzschia fraudulenta, Strain WWA7" /LENGTH=394 /DNA_ID=CAMNT_0047382017 /DNA_START=303 /DNA_END=1487 /DNA_ORIENTATION=-